MVVPAGVGTAQAVGVVGPIAQYFTLLLGGGAKEQGWSNLMPRFLAQATQWSVH